ncbi:auxin-responsive protein SAUR64-like [Actinidia eriantha]|uniref:auxin-responsive protein SAUR64-like n=1 Tax=Actinidia eriantha TaxID=165200 RepID=UPI00258E2905|nr:auxin-responsive protein SAUR64-like [Actinidia eriantha]
MVFLSMNSTSSIVLQMLNAGKVSVSPNGQPLSLKKFMKVVEHLTSETNIVHQLDQFSFQSCGSQDLQSQKPPASDPMYGQEVAAIRRNTISLSRANLDAHAGTNSSSSSVADKVHFVDYTADQRRFVFPIVYLQNDIFSELLKLSEEELGLPSDGPITLPFDVVFMDYVVFFVQRHATLEIQNALLMSIQKTRCSVSYSLHQERPFQQLLVFSF